MTSNIGERLLTENRATDNKGAALISGQCLVEVLCFKLIFVLAENLVLPNAHLRQALNRYVTPNQTNLTMTNDSDLSFGVT